LEFRYFPTMKRRNLVFTEAKMPAPTALIRQPEEVAEAAANVPLPAEGMRLTYSLWN
jgi:hypothetical protein